MTICRQASFALRRCYRPGSKLFLATLVMALLAPGEPSLSQSSRIMGPGISAVFGCDAGRGHVCFFTVFDPDMNAVSRFRVAAGERFPISFNDGRAYSYMVTIDDDYTRYQGCDVPAKDHVFCKMARVQEGYNN